MQEAEQQLHLAVAGATAHAGEAGVEVVGALDERLDGVGEGQLAVVVAMDADLLALASDYLQVSLHERLDLLRIQKAEAVDDIDDTHRCFGKHLERFIQLPLRDRRSRHDVDARLVPLVVGVLDHTDRQGDLMDVAGYADHVEHALLLRQNIGLVVALFRISHGRQLERGVVVTDDAPHILLAGVTPGTVVLCGKLRTAVDVADLHIVDAGGDAGGVYTLNNGVIELGVVHQAAITNGGVENLDVLAVGQPALGGGVGPGFSHFLLSLGAGSVSE